MMKIELSEIKADKRYKNADRSWGVIIPQLVEEIELLRALNANAQDALEWAYRIRRRP